MKYKEENIGNIFKEAFEDYSPEPDIKVWDNVLNESKPKGFFKNSFFKGFAAAFISGAIIISAIVLLNNKKDDKTDNQIINKQKEQNIVVEPQNKNENNNESINKEHIIKSDIETEVAEQKQTDNTDVNESEKQISSQDSDNKEIDEKSNIAEVEKAETKTSSNPEVPLKTSNDSGGLEETNKEIGSVNPKPVIIDQKIPEKSGFDSSNIEFSPDPIICFGEDAELTVSEGYRYKWNTGAISNKIKVSPVSNSTYLVTVTDEKGNNIKHNFNVTVDKSCTSVLIPNAFSPDNDGINDKLEVFGKGITDFNMKILSRNGKTVFVTTDINNFWDGTDNGRVLPSGVYVYQMVYTDAKGNKQIKQGTVSIIK